SCGETSTGDGADGSPRRAGQQALDRPNLGGKFSTTPLVTSGGWVPMRWVLVCLVLLSLSLVASAFQQEKKELRGTLPPLYRKLDLQERQVKRSSPRPATSTATRSPSWRSRSRN